MDSLQVSAILNAVWPVSTALLAITAFMLYRRRLHREHPFFFGYLLFVGGRSPILFLLRRDQGAYFYAYWAAEAVTVAISFLVIYEIYQHVAGSSSLTTSRSTFFSLTVGFLALAALSALFMETPPGSPLVRGIMVLTHSARTMQAGLLALLMAASLFFNFYWKSVPFGFALGYGIYATVELIATALRTSIGLSADPIFRLAKVLGYQVALVVWVVFIYRHREAHALKELPSQSMNDWVAITGRQR